MFWTHIFDLLGKAFAVAITVIVILLPFWLWNDRQLAIPSIIGGAVAGGAAWWWILRPLSSWLYARVHLGTRLSWDQARQASVLFSPIRNLVSWHPMKECRILPTQERAAAIMAGVDEIRDYYRAGAAEWQSAPRSAKVVRVLLWVAMGSCAIATLANVPPFSWLNQLQGRMFDGSYYPILSVIVAILPAGIGLSLLEKKLGVRSLDPAAYVPAPSIQGPDPVEVRPPPKPPVETVERDWRPPSEAVRKDSNPPA